MQASITPWITWAFVLLLLGLLPAHYASAQSFFDNGDPTNGLTYTIVEDARPPTVSSGALLFGVRFSMRPGAVTAQDTAGLYGRVVVTPGSGRVESNTAVLTYTLDNNNPTVDALLDGDTLTDTFTVAGEQTSEAGAGPVSATVTINIQGVTDIAATISATSPAPLTEGTLDGAPVTVIDARAAASRTLLAGQPPGVPVMSP